MEQNKYFTPDTEDLYVGYQLEANFKGFETEDDYWKLITLVGIGQEIIKYNTQGIYRVPYLTKEQIEAEGWTSFITEYEGDIKLENMNYVFFNEKVNYMLGWYFNTHKIALLVKDPAKAIDLNGDIIEYQNTPIFRGECKDINTFRKIIKLLNIK